MVFLGKNFNWNTTGLPGIVFLFVLLSATFVLAQNPKSTQWKQAGGEIIFQTTHKFTTSWSSDCGSRDNGNKYWAGSFYEPVKKRKYAPWEPTVRESVAPLLGQVTVQGPGVVGLFERTKGGGSIYMRDVKTQGVYYPFRNSLRLVGTGKWTGSVRDFKPGEAWGRVPKDAVVTIDIGAAMSSYDNRMNTGEYSFHAPQEVTEAEVWFFPKPGGKVVKVIKFCPDGGKVDITDGDRPCKGEVQKTLSIEEIKKLYCAWGEKEKTWKDGSTDKHALFSKIAGGGEIANLLDTLGVDWASRFSCVALQWKTLYFLAEQRKAGKLRGWDYIPIKCWGERPSELAGHHAVVIYPSGGDWRKDGFTMDPHPSQKCDGSVRPIKDWAGWLRKFTSFDNCQMADTYGGKMVDGAYIRQSGKKYNDDYILTQNPQTAVASWETSIHDCVKLGISGPVNVFVTNSRNKHYGLLPDGSWKFKFNIKMFDPWKTSRTRRSWYFELPDDYYKADMVAFGSGIVHITVLFDNRIFEYPPVEVAPGDHLTIIANPETSITAMTSSGATISPKELTLDEFVAMAEGGSVSHSSISATNPTRRLYPVADAYVYAYSYRNWNRSNRGKYDQLVAGWHPTGGESRAYLRFDLSHVKERKVSKALLRLYHFQTSGSNGVDLGVYQVTSPWEEGSDTYHSGRVETTAAPGALSWVHQPASVKHPTASFNPGKGSMDWTEIDIAPLVNQWLSGMPNYGLVIKPMSHQSTSVYHFASRERDPGLDKPTGKNKAPVLILNGQNTDSKVVKGGNIVYDQVHTFAKCFDKIGCAGGSPWSVCGAKDESLSQDQAYAQSTHFIEISVHKKSKITVEVKQLKKCMNGCEVWFDRMVAGKWQYAGNTLGQAAPGRYRAIVLSDGFKGCGYPYKQVSFCPSRCRVKLSAYPVDPAIAPHRAVSIIVGKNQSETTATPAEPKKPTNIHIPAGEWMDNYGNKVTVLQSGASIMSTPLENKGPVGWKKAEGILTDHTITMNFNGLTLTGTVKAGNKKIFWSNGSIWTYQNKTVKSISNHLPDNRKRSRYEYKDVFK